MQIELWKHYHDVVVNDNTAKTNAYNMLLNLFVVVDNQHRTRLVAQSLVQDETIGSYIWILNCILKATDNLPPRAIFTDANLAMISAINQVFSSSKHNYCIFHIQANLAKKLS